MISPEDKVYISGPMSGRPFFNRPLFVVAGELLRHRFGCTVLNPALTTDDFSLSWVDYMRMDMELLHGATKLLMLPGWQRSRGANIERRVYEGLTGDIAITPRTKGYPFPGLPAPKLAVNRQRIHELTSRKDMLAVSEYFWRELSRWGMSRADIDAAIASGKEYLSLAEVIDKTVALYLGQDLKVPPCASCRSSLVACCMATGAECYEFSRYTDGHD